MRKTAICDLLGIEYPVIQGGMAWVAEHNLAAAVSNAGGLGIIAAANAPYEYVRDEIRKTKELTDRPFGVNIMLLSPHAEDVARVVVEEKVPVVTTGAGKSGNLYETVEGSRNQGDPGCCLCGACKTDAAGGRGCGGSGRLRVRRTHR